MNSPNRELTMENSVLLQERAAQFLHALAQPARLRILELIGEGELCGCEIEPHLELDQSTVSRHLQVLRRAGILRARKYGVRVLYRLRHPGVLQVLRDVEALIAEQAREELVRLGTPASGGG